MHANITCQEWAFRHNVALPVCSGIERGPAVCEEGVALPLGEGGADGVRVQVYANPETSFTRPLSRGRINHPQRHLFNVLPATTCLLWFIALQQLSHFKLIPKIPSPRSNNVDV
jgi:hypothetical protein